MMNVIFLALAASLTAVEAADVQPDVLYLEPAPAPDTSAIGLTLEDALKIALSENIPVKIADKEITRKKYEKRGVYAALYPQIDATAAYQYTIKKQVMYMDNDGGSSIGSMMLEALWPYFQQLYAQHPDIKPVEPVTPGGGSSEGMSVGRLNNWSAGVTATMPLVNAQLWESLKLSDKEVELAVEKARSSRLDMVTEVKNAFYAVLLAKEALKVADQVYENAKKNYEVAEAKYRAQKSSQLDYLRAHTTVANAIPDVYSARNSIELALWRLKAVMGVDLDYNIVANGSLADYAQQMFYDIHSNDITDLSRNTSLKQLSMQVDELATTVKRNQMAYVPSLSLAFNYTYSAMANDFNFSEYKWTPYSYIGLSLSIPIFSGMRRWNAVKQSKVQYEQLKLQQTNTERQLRILVKSDLSTMETGMKSYYSAISAVESAQKGYDITAKSFEVGRSTIVDVNAAMLALVNAQTAQWQAVYEFLTAKSDLEKQLGKDYNQE